MWDWDIFGTKKIQKDLNERSKREANAKKNEGLIDQMTDLQKKLKSLHAIMVEDNKRLATIKVRARKHNRKNPLLEDISGLDNKLGDHHGKINKVVSELNKLMKTYSSIPGSTKGLTNFYEKDIT